jgi:putative membrane protein
LEPATLLYAMDVRRVLTAGLFNFSLTLFAALFAVLNTFDDVLPFDVLDPDSWIDLIGRDNAIFDYVDAHRWLVAGLGLASMAILGVVTGMITTLLREYGFSLHRTQTGLRRTRGLFTRTDVSLPIRRVQAVVISTGLVKRYFGWRSLGLQSLASDENKQSDHIAAPLANRAESATILAELSLQEPDDAHVWQRVHPVYPWGIVPLLLVAIMAIGIAAYTISAWLWLAAFAVVAFAMLYAVQRARHGWHFDGRVLYIRRSGWGQKYAIIPARNIQCAELVEGPIYRRFGVVSLSVDIAGGSTVNPHSIHALSRDLATRLRQQLLAVQ